MADRFPCPCCGHLALDQPLFYDLCPVCFWEDDPNELRWPGYVGGANGTSLMTGQHNFLAFGAMHLVFRNKVREAALSESVETGWRILDPSRDSFKPIGVREAPWPDDLTTLYYWRPMFWRRGAAQT